MLLDVPRPRVGLLSNGEEQARGSPLVVAARAELAERVAAVTGAAPFEFVGNVEGGDLTSGAADVVVTDGFTGNVALKVIEGVSQTMLRAIRDAAALLVPREAGGPAAAPSLRAFRERSTPRVRAAPTCWGCAGWGSCPTGASPAAASRRRSCAPRAARRRTSWGAPTRRWSRPARCAARRLGAPSARDASLQKDDPRAGIRADPRPSRRRARPRPEAIIEETRFKEDLEADSLDLYTLVQELEDTYGVRISDEQAAGILTVGQAVDFVLAQAGAEV